MRPHHYLAVLVRLFAIALLVFAIKESGQLIQLIRYDGIVDTPFPIFILLSGVGLPLAISVVLWFFPVVVASLILKPEIDQVMETTDNISIFFVLVAAIGLYVTFNAFIDSIYFLFLWQIANSQDTLNDVAHFFPADTKANIWATGLQLIVGLILVFKSKAIARKITEFAT